MARCFVAAVMFSLLSLPLCASAGSAIVLHPEQQFEFAEHYFDRGEYYRAIGEYERLIHFFPGDEKVEIARYKIGLSYLKGERYQEAIEAFQNVIDTHGTSPYAIKAYLGISHANVRLKRYDEALLTLQDLIAVAPDQDVKDEGYYQCGWVYLEKGRWEEARGCFNNVSSANRDKYRLRQLTEDLEKEKVLRHKDPGTAGLLAIIPGAGHLYCERYREAFISFLVNGALIFAAYQAFNHDQNVLCGVIGLVEVGFYSGNIYSAISSAHKFNRDEENRFLNHLKEHARVNLSLERPRDGGAVLISCKVEF
jgi:tetratricopeptide (TPR) repeat protein